MPFLAPLYLLGLAAASIPVVIHMIHRRRAQRVLFPTIRFLKASNERTSRRQKIQDLFLLLLRVLLFVLLSVALAQPFLGSRARGLGRRIHAVILLDNSFSMGTVHEGKSRLDAAKELAMVAVDSLPEGSQAALLLACPPTGAAKPMLLSDRDKLRNDILKAPLSQSRADLTAAVQRAYDLLLAEEEKAPTLEVYALTDLQRNTWTPPSDADEARQKSAGPQPNLVLIDVGSEDIRNLAVTDLLVRGGAHVRGRPIGLQAKIHNFSPKTATLNITLYTDRTKQTNQQLEIPANLVATASFTHAFDHAGVHTGWVQIDDDSLALDNRRDFCLDLQDHIPAVLFRDATPGLASLDPAFFIAKALDPFGDDPTTTAALVQTTVTDFAHLSRDFLRPFQVAVLVDPGSLKKSEIADLARYVRRGGRLLIFAGPNLRPDTLNTFLSGDGPEPALMPVTISEPSQGLVDRKNFKSLVNLDLDHEALRVFKDFRRLVQTVKVYNYAPVEVEQSSPARVLIGLSDGNPFLLENAVDKGRVLLFSTTTDPDWTNLGAGRFLVPLLHRLVYYLTERREVEASHLVGTPVPLSLRDVSHAVTFQVRDPDGAVLDLPAQPTASGVQATFTQTDKRGPYLYVVVDPQKPAESTAEAAKAEAERGFVVNLHPDESDLAKIPPGELERLLKGHRTWFAATAEELRGVIDRMREGVPLRNLILFIVLFIAVFETFFANRIVPALQRAEESASAAAPASSSRPAS